MRLPVKFMLEASEEVAAVRAWFEEQRVGSGEGFLGSLRKTVERVENNPELYGIVFEDVRAAKLHRFPYVVYYVVEEERTVVVSVRHGRRKTTDLRRRHT